GSEVTFDRNVHFPLNRDLASLTPGQYQFGVRASHIGLQRQADDDLELDVTVDIAEISGSETFLHVHNDLFHLVLHLAGVHEFGVDQRIKVYFPTHKIYAFDRHGDVVHIPARPGAH
ncbi:MAG: ABC transporter ATP-binding protein, partial [Halomonas sp.]|nr:ABC transporter ATP-binding protein [Halomonas sp.]